MNFFSNSFAFYINGSRFAIEELTSYVKNRFWDPNRDHFAVQLLFIIQNHYYPNDDDKADFIQVHLQFPLLLLSTNPRN